MLSNGTCGIGRDGIPRGLALWDTPLPVAAVVGLGGPSPRRGAARWVSAPGDPWGCRFLGRGRSESPRGAWEWRGLAWRLDSGSGGGAALAVCVGGQCSDPRVGGLAPRALLGTGLPSDPSYSASCLTEPFAGLPPPRLPRQLGPPDSLQATLDPALTSGSLLGARRGCVPM